MDKESERRRIGLRIAELRKAKGLTQAQLAEKTGFSQSNIGRIETGKYSVGLDVLAKIADALGAKVEIKEEKRAVLRNISGYEVLVHATSDHPDSSYGQEVWVDYKGTAYCIVGKEEPYFTVKPLDK